MTETDPFDPTELLARYLEGPDRLEAAVAGLAGADLDRGPGPGSWTIRQIAHHVVDGDDIWQMCIKMALGNCGCRFHLEWYWDLPQDTWAERWNYAGRPLEPSLALFRANRAHVAQLVGSIPDAWSQHVVIAWLDGEQEQPSVRDVVDMQAGHTLAHVEDILAIRKLHGV